MTVIRFTPQMRAQILKAKQKGGKTQCDPRAFYPVGHVCAATTQPVHITGNGKPRPPWHPVKSIPLIYDPERFRGRPVESPVPVNGAVTRQTETPDGGTRTEIEADNGETVVATTAPNGAVREVEVRPRLFENPLVPLALGAAALFLLGG